MNNGLPFQDWDIDIDRHRALQLGLVAPTEEVDRELEVDKPKLYIASPAWIVIQAANDYRFVVKREIYRRLVDLSRFLSEFFHYHYYNQHIPRKLFFRELDPYIMSVCCKYLHWKYKNGKMQERPGFITNPKLFNQVLRAARTLRILANS